VRGSEDVEILIGCVDITSENGAIDREVYGSSYSEGISVNTDTPVIVIKQPWLINAATNTRSITLARISVSCSKKGVFKVWLTRDPSSIIGATFKRVGGGSFVETDSTDMDVTAVRATSVVTANMKFITSIPVEAQTRIAVDNPYRGKIEFTIVRGDFLVVTGTSPIGIAECVIEWGEQI
jgi:hypothetical protein